MAIFSSVVSIFCFSHSFTEFSSPIWIFSSHQNFLSKLNSNNNNNNKKISLTTTTLSQARTRHVATSSGELVFFGGGYNSTGASDRVDIYNVTSGNWTTATLSIPRGDLAATSSQNLVFFAGGWNRPTEFNQVDIYNVTSGNWSTATQSKTLLSWSHFCWKSCSLWRWLFGFKR
jgi:hypothetical protein